jgi:hypothetical protein
MLMLAPLFTVVHRVALCIQRPSHIVACHINQLLSAWKGSVGEGGCMIRSDLPSRKSAKSVRVLTSNHAITAMFALLYKAQKLIPCSPVVCHLSRHSVFGLSAAVLAHITADLRAA